MGKARFSTGQRKDIFLYSTTVENLFINEFLPDAPGDCVKVFLFGLMYAQIGEDVDTRTMAITLGMSENDVENAWKYWESKGLVAISGSQETGDCEIEFVRQIDQFYGKSIEETYHAVTEGLSDNTAEAEKSAEEIIANLINQQLKEIFDKYQMMTGRTMSRHEVSKFTDAVKVYGIEPDVLDFAIDYCISIDKSSVDYIFKVALRWKEEGCRDVAQVKKLLDRQSRRNDFYRQVFKAVGFTRLPNPSDREIMDKWFDDMGLSIKDVLDACKATAGMREPNLRYVNKVLENKALEKGGINTRTRTSPDEGLQPQAAAARTSEGPQAMVSRKVLKDYFEYIRSEAERENYARIDEVCAKVPEMRDIYTQENELTNAVISITPGVDSRDKMQRLREQRRSLEERKKEVLRRSGYPEDYLERKYKCGICKDTGYTDEGRTCTCCRERAEEAYKWIQRTKN